MVYAINYDLGQPNGDYSGLLEEIKRCGAWWHYLESTWLVDTRLTAEDLWDRLKAHIHPQDSVLIHAVGRDHQGWLPQKAWDWINNRQWETV